MDELECLSDKEITREYIGMFFNNLVKHIDDKTKNNIKNKFIETYKWYLHTYHNDFELFGYALLTYLIFLSDNNLIDDYSLDSLAEVAPFSGTLSLLDVHFMINYPKLNHDTNISLYYENMMFLFSTLSMNDFVSMNNHRLILLANMLEELEPLSMEYSKEAYYNNYLSQLLVFLYQSDEYEEDDLNNLYKNMEENYGQFVEYMTLNGIGKTANLEKRELIFNGYIKQTINVKKYIK